TRNVVRLFKELTVEDGTAILMVTHDHRIIELADRLVHMVDGRIVSDILLNDALRICEFLKGVEVFKALTPTELTHVAERMAKGLSSGPTPLGGDFGRVAQHVAAAPDGLDVVIAAGGLRELLAQLADEDVDDLQLGLVHPAIEMVQEHLLGQRRALAQAEEL